MSNLQLCKNGIWVEATSEEEKQHKIDCKNHWLPTVKKLGLPEDVTIHWWNLDTDYMDQDVCWLELSNGIGIDVGYSRKMKNNFITINQGSFHISIVGSKEEWCVFESSVCKTKREVRSEVKRLARKFNKPFYAKLCKESREWRVDFNRKCNDPNYDWGDSPQSLEDMEKAVMFANAENYEI